jgi:hypothetical protein
MNTTSITDLPRSRPPVLDLTATPPITLARLVGVELRSSAIPGPDDGC